MKGLKALHIEKYAKKNNLAFLRFDCRGHGNSHGKFEDFTLSFIVDEYLENYLSMYSWITGQGFPQSRQQFIDFRDNILNNNPVLFQHDIIRTDRKHKGIEELIKLKKCSR